MAELILTDAEKAAVSWLALSDEDLGKLCRKCVLDMPALFSDASDNKRLWAFTAGMLLCKVAAEANVDKLEFTGRGVRVGAANFGDWLVTVRRLCAKRKVHQK